MISNFYIAKCGNIIKMMYDKDRHNVLIVKDIHTYKLLECRGDIHINHLHDVDSDKTYLFHDVAIKDGSKIFIKTDTIDNLTIHHVNYYTDKTISNKRKAKQLVKDLNKNTRHYQIRQTVPVSFNYEGLVLDCEN